MKPDPPEPDIVESSPPRAKKGKGKKIKTEKIKNELIVKGEDEAEKKTKRSQSVTFDTPLVFKRTGIGPYATRSCGIDGDDDNDELPANIFDPMAGEEIDDIEEIEEVNAAH